MRAVLFINGVYGCYHRYEERLRSADLVLCADGGANQAYEWKIKVDVLLGDMDSVRPEVLAYYRQQGSRILVFPPAKDETDTQIALRAAVEMGADEILLCGSMGGRMDHAFSNLMAGVGLAKRGIRLLHTDVDCDIWLTASALELSGKKGDTVSVFSLTEKASGVTLQGFAYPLHEAELDSGNPYAVSNVLLEETGKIQVKNGVIAVMHWTE